MNPQTFPQTNLVMKAPKGMPECCDVHACRTTCNGAPVVVTAWRPTPEELVKINLGEPVFLLCWGQSMPPVAVTADNPFDT